MKYAAICTRLLLPGLVLGALWLGSCKERTYIHEVEEVVVLPQNATKTKQKSPEQFLNIAWANLHQSALPPDQLVELSELITSIGDKQVAYEAVIAKMMKDPEVKLPTMQEMRADLDYFIEQTYRRFYVRIPTEAEKLWWRNYLETHPDVTPEQVYFSFATSNEYYHY